MNNKGNLNNRNDPNYDKDKHEPFKLTKKYSERKYQTIQWMYLIFIIFWGLLVWLLNLKPNGFLGWIILLIPVVFYSLGYFNAPSLTVEVEEKTYSVTFISLALLVVIPLVAWVNTNFHGNKWYLCRILVVAVILALISLIDIWVRPKWVSFVRHFKSALQTASLTLLVFALYTYYMGQGSNSLEYNLPIFNNMDLQNNSSKLKVTSP